MADFPVHPEQVTAAWLGDVLGTPVASVAWESIGTGQVGDSARFHIRYEGADGRATLAGKFPAADPTSRNTAVMMGLYRKEVGFYRELAPQLDIRVPNVLVSHLADDGADFMLLFEDLGPARGGNQLDSCSIDDARHAIRQAAALHAPSWNRAAIVDIPILQPAPGLSEQIAQMYPQAHAVFADRYRDTLEPEYMKILDTLAQLSGQWFDREPTDRCLVHGDFRLDNMLFDIRDGSEPIAVLDWQTVTTGNAMTDIGYFLGCGIGDALRRAHETELIDLYCEEMTRRGVHLTRKMVWDDYRIGALHGASTAVFSAAFVERTERGDANFLSMARGACALALEHDSLGALKGEM